METQAAEMKDFKAAMMAKAAQAPPQPKQQLQASDFMGAAVGNAGAAVSSAAGDVLGAAVGKAQGFAKSPGFAKSMAPNERPGVVPADVFGRGPRECRGSPLRPKVRSQDEIPR